MLQFKNVVILVFMALPLAGQSFEVILDSCSETTFTHTGTQVSSVLDSVFINQQVVEEFLTKSADQIPRVGGMKYQLIDYLRTDEQLILLTQELVEYPVHDLVPRSASGQSYQYLYHRYNWSSDLSKFILFKRVFLGGHRTRIYGVNPWSPLISDFKKTTGCEGKFLRSVYSHDFTLEILATDTIELTATQIVYETAELAASRKCGYTEKVKSIHHLEEAISPILFRNDRSCIELYCECE